MGILFFACINVFAQNDTLTKQSLDDVLLIINKNIQSLQNENNRLKTEISNLNANLTNVHNDIDSLKMRTQANSNSISQTAQELGIKISDAETNTIQKISDVDNSLSRKNLWAIIGILAAIIVSGILYLVLRKKQLSDKTDMITQLSQTKSSIEENLVQEFSKQTELMDTQFDLIKEQKEPTNISIEPDHSLALKVASEINIIERNISLMDSGTKGLKQLLRSVEKLKDNLAANDYEVPQLLGKSFRQGMKVIVSNSIPDENLDKGAEIITKVLIPQVNYKGVMIQTAHIEVSVGY